MARPPRDPATPARHSLRIIAFAMIAAVATFAAVAIALAPGLRPAPPPAAAVWGLAAAGLLLLVAGLGFGGGDDRKRILSLALRESCGLIGGVLTLLTGSPAWAAALGGLSIAALILGLAGGGDSPPGEGRSAKSGSRRIG